MAEEEKKKEAEKKRKPLMPPYIPDTEVPDPSVPNRAHTEMSQKSEDVYEVFDPPLGSNGAIPFENTVWECITRDNAAQDIK